jgi:hypothetical protein
MTIWRLVLVPHVTYINGEPQARERIYTVEQDQVTTITNNNDGTFTVVLSDLVDEGVTTHREIVVFSHQVRNVYQNEIVV